MRHRILYWSSHYLLIGLYVLFALFPLYWLVKVALRQAGHAEPAHDSLRA